MVYSNTVVPYTSAIPNKICWEKLHKYFKGWRFLVSPASTRSFGKKREHLLYEQGFALDNGAYSYWHRGLDFPTKEFNDCLKKYGSAADWIVLPDVVRDWDATHKFSNEWYEQLKGMNKLLVVTQNGCEKNNWSDLYYWLDKGVGIFVGGTDEFKKDYTPFFAEVCKERNLICHVGRVNSILRANWVKNCGAFSFDGSGMSRFMAQAERMSKHMLSLHQNIQLSLFSDNNDIYFQDMREKYF